MIAFIVVFTMSIVIIFAMSGLLLSEKLKKPVFTDNSSQTDQGPNEWTVVVQPEDVLLARVV